MNSQQLAINQKAIFKGRVSYTPTNLTVLGWGKATSFCLHFGKAKAYFLPPS